MSKLEITVKTLDSQNHKFNVASDLTVKQFKETIAQSVSVQPESQRLIYCGRVLQDEKKLTDYDLNSKVVHLVQKLPPQANPRPSQAGASSRSSGAGANPGTRRSNTQARHNEGNSMYLGALAFPSDMFSIQTTQEMMQTAASSRLNVVRSMLRQASRVIGHLENPNASPPAPPAPPSSAAAATETEDEAFRGFEPEMEGTFTTSVPLAENLSQEDAQDAAADAMAGAVSAAVAGALSAIVSAVGTSIGAPNITIMQQGGGTAQGPSQATAQTMQGGAASANQSQPTAMTSSQTTPATGSSNAQHSASEENTTNSAPPPSTGPQPASTSAENNQSPRTPQRRIRSARTTVMADAMEELLRLQDRLRPFHQRISQLLRDDPALEAGSAALEEAQRTFSQVSECMHLLSHVYHNLSDLSCNLSRAPPRAMGVRSLVLQPTAVLQAGFPIQAQINVMTNRVSPTSSSPPGGATSTAENVTQPATTTPNTASQTAAQANPHSVSTAQAAPQVGAQTVNQSTSSAVGSEDTGEETPNAPAGSNSNHTPQSQQVPPPRRNPLPFPFPHGNLELIMEVGPGGISFEPVTSPGSTSATATTYVETSGTGARRTRVNTMETSPPELIQNIMQAMASQIMGGVGIRRPRTPVTPRTARTSAGTSASATATPSSSSSSTGNQGTQANQSTQAAATNTPGGVASQARGNTATHPTTSTQTRSTARPHVHLAPANWQAPQNFDPYLQCNSHHIQPLLRLQRPQQTQTPTAGQTRTQARPQARGGQTRPVTATVRPTVVSNLTSATQQVLGNNFDEGFMNLQSNLTVADFLTSMPDYSHTDGESFFTDLFIVVARHFTFRDLVQLSLHQSAPLNRLQLPLRQFVSLQLLGGATPTPENISGAVDRVIMEIRPYLEVVRASQLREEVNYEATIRQYCHARLPELVTLIMTEGGDAAIFGTQLMRLCGEFMKDLASLTLMCCHGGRQGLERILHRYVQVLTGDLDPIIQQWTSANSRIPIRSFVQSLSPLPGSLERFMVRDSPSSSEVLPLSSSAATPVTAPVSTAVPAQETCVNNGNQPEQQMDEAMECEEEFVLALEEPGTIARAVLETPLVAMETDSEPCDVVVGSEEWHNGLDPEWVPVITRDIQRQRRQPEQAPFSDAYLAGMSSKRRKLVSSAKPQGTIGQVLGESVQEASRSAGVQPAGGSERLGQAAATDPALQTAYKKEVRHSVSQQLTTDPNFTPDRFPNAQKYFNPPK